jgi:hypothetical protein
MDIPFNGLNIQMLLYNRFENLDLFGPFDVFALAEKLQKLYERVAAKGKLGYIGGRRLKGGEEQVSKGEGTCDERKSNCD